MKNKLHLVLDSIKNVSLDKKQGSPRPYVKWQQRCDPNSVINAIQCSEKAENPKNLQYPDQ